MSPVASPPHTRPADVYAEWQAAKARLDAHCDRGRAAAALDFVIRYTPVTAAGLADVLNVSKPTISNWRKRRVEFTHEAIWRITAALAAPTFPASSDELDTMIAAGIDGHADLYDRFFSDNDQDAFVWLFEHRAANFRWNTGVAAA